MNTTNSNKDDDIFNFIIKKCQEPDIDSKKVIYLFLKSYIHALCKTLNTTKNINYSLSCADLARNIFNIIYNYTHNVRVSIFMIERTTFLFNEYLNVSQSFNSIEIQINEIKNYIIHKTIGSIHINNKLNNINNNPNITNDIYSLSIISNFIKNIFIKLNTEQYISTDLEKSIFNNDKIIIENNDDTINKDFDPLLYNLEQSMLLLHSVIYRSILNGLTNIIEPILEEFINLSINDLSRNINILRLHLELILYSKLIFKDIIKAKHISNDIIDKYMNILDDDDNLNEFMDYSQSISNHIHFKAMKELLHK